MSFTMIILVALGLSTDSFAVSLSNGLSMEKINIRNAFIIATFFGLFHGFMPLLGWILGKGVSCYILGYDCWLVFVIILFIGIKMIYDALTKNMKNETVSIKLGSLKAIIVLSFLTSIDTLAFGMKFSCQHMCIIYPVLVLGVMTFVLSFLGVCIGKRLGKLLGRKIEAFGGLILVMVAFEFLLENYHIINIY